MKKSHQGSPIRQREEGRRDVGCLLALPRKTRRNKTGRRSDRSGTSTTLQQHHQQERVNDVAYSLALHACMTRQSEWLMQRVSSDRRSLHETMTKTIRTSHFIPQAMSILGLSAESLNQANSMRHSATMNHATPTTIPSTTKIKSTIKQETTRRHGLARSTSWHHADQEEWIDLAGFPSMNTTTDNLVPTTTQEGIDDHDMIWTHHDHVYPQFLQAAHYNDYDVEEKDDLNIHNTHTNFPIHASRLISSRTDTTRMIDAADTHLLPVPSRATLAYDSMSHIRSFIKSPSFQIQHSMSSHDPFELMDAADPELMFVPEENDDEDEGPW